MLAKQEVVQVDEFRVLRLELLQELILIEHLFQRDVGAIQQGINRGIGLKAILPIHQGQSRQRHQGQEIASKVPG